jgi:hypothetical protein
VKAQILADEPNTTPGELEEAETCATTIGKIKVAVELGAPHVEFRHAKTGVDFTPVRRAKGHSQQAASTGRFGIVQAIERFLEAIATQLDAGVQGTQAWHGIAQHARCRSGHQRVEQTPQDDAHKQKPCC